MSGQDGQVVVTGLPVVIPLPQSLPRKGKNTSYLEESDPLYVITIIIINIVLVLKTIYAYCQCTVCAKKG